MPVSRRAKQVTFSRLRAVSRDLIYMATVPDGQELGTPFVGLCQYDAEHWSYEAYDLEVADMALFKAPDQKHRVMCALDEDGRLLDVDTKQVVDIRARARGLSGEHRLGHLLRIKQIGAHLYVTGDGGQTYRREHDGTWTVLDPALLNGPSRALELGMMMSDAVKSPSALAEYKRQARADQSTRLSGLDGLDEKTLYTCSENSQVFWYDGAHFVEVSAQADNEALLDILVETTDRVWVCGRHGTLLFGNRRDGFQQVAGVGLSASFSRMALLGGKLYLGAYANPRGLFVYEEGRMQRVRCGLKPDIEDVNMIEAVDGMLWVMGTKDLLRFDGAIWERIPFPGNDPVR